jgi:hypothetical protein
MWMKMPFKLGLHGRKVPGKYVRTSNAALTVRFVGIVIITELATCYHFRNLFELPLVRIDGDGYANVHFQSPENQSGGVLLDTRPIIPSWFLGLLAASLLWLVFN